MKILANFAMLSDVPNGLNAYANRALKVLSKSGDCEFLISKKYSGQLNSCRDVPDGIGIGSGLKGAFYRFFWANQQRVEDGYLIYSPTHHYIARGYNNVITIHDLIALKFPRQHFFQYLYFRFALPRVLKRCRAIFTVSETTKVDLINQYKLKDSNIYVVPNCIDVERFSDDENIDRRSLNKINPYLLFVGARYPHKNLGELIDRHELWSKNYRLVVVNCTGDYRKLINNLLAKFDLFGRVEFLENIPKEELVRLYKGAAALVYPSKWEGFGIPPLEAISYGCPVIASDIPVLREVLGQTAVFVKLGSVDSWGTAFQSLKYVQENYTTWTSDVVSILDKYSVAAYERSISNALSSVMDLASSS